MELKKIGILSLGKIAALIGLIAGIIAAIVLMILQKVMTNIPASELGLQDVTLLTWKTALLIPIYYAIVGFIWGIVLAFLYNILAKHIGGIKLEFKEAGKKK